MLRQTMNDSDQIELHDINEKQRKIETAQKASVIAGILDSANITTMFALLSTQTLRLILEEVAKFIILPAALGFSIIQAGLAWRQAQLSGGKTEMVVKAAVETVAATVITATIIGSLAASIIFGAITPIVFTAVIGAKALFHAGSAVYYWGKSAGTQNEGKKAEYREKAKTNAVQAFALTLATVAVATVMVFGKVALAGLGIASGIFNMLYLGTKAHQLFANKKKGYQALPTEPTTESDNEKERDVMRPNVNTTLSSQARISQVITNNASSTAPQPEPMNQQTTSAQTNNIIRSDSALRRNKKVDDLMHLEHTSFEGQPSEEVSRSYSPR
jgi:hypothetical protein